MALETALGDLRQSLDLLHETLLGLRTTITEDKPLQDDVVLVDMFGDAVDDLIGLLDEALAMVQARPGTPAAARQMVMVCQHQANQISERFGSDLVSYERIAALKRLGRRRRGEWQPWTISVRHGLATCQQPLCEVHHALFRSWQELTEHAATVHV